MSSSLTKTPVELAPTVAGAVPEQVEEQEHELVLERGELVGRYVVLGPIGAGGMSVVYAAYDPDLDRKVALKFLRPQAGGTPEHGYGRQVLLREAQAMARLRHPNVLGVYEVGRLDGRIYLVLEHVEGCTLADWLAACPRTWREIVSMFAQAGRGLAAVHGAGLAHRDFKPENVLIGRDGTVVVCDFGLACRPEQGAPSASTAADERALDEYRRTQASEVDSNGQVFGTPQYMAPEQHMGAPADARSDQFGFCVALYEALYDQRPFAGRNVAQVRIAVTSGHILPPPDDADVPAHLFADMSRGMSVRPDDRFPTMDALLAALLTPVRALTVQPRRARAARAQAAAPAFAHAETGVVPARIEAAPPRERVPQKCARRALWAAAAALALLGLGAGAWAAERGSSPAAANGAASATAGAASGPAEPMVIIAVP